MREELKKWLDSAYEDLRVAKLVMGEGIYNQVCFHAQQCVEKALKCFIICKDKLHPQTHKLADILSVMQESPFEPLKEEILLLDRFYTLTRYPDALPGTLPEELPTRNDAREALDIAKKVYEIAQREVESK